MNNRTIIKINYQNHNSKVCQYNIIYVDTSRQCVCVSGHTYVLVIKDKWNVISSIARKYFWGILNPFWEGKPIYLSIYQYTTEYSVLSQQQ